MAASTAAAVRPATLPAATGRAGLRGALRSEFTKIRSTRSTYWTLLVLIVVTVGFGALTSWGSALHPKSLGPGFDPTQRSLTGLYFGQLIIAVLATLVVTSEYSTGMIGPSLTAMPRRGTLLAAKALVLASVALVTGLVASFGAFFLGQSLMASHHVNATLGQPQVLRAVIGAALFLTVGGLLAFGIGTILRHTAGAITASIGLLFVVSLLVNFLPASWQNHLDKWIPAVAGSQVWSTKATVGGPPQLSAWTGLAVFAGYAAIVLLGGLILFRRRDA